MRVNKDLHGRASNAAVQQSWQISVVGGTIVLRGGHQTRACTELGRPLKFNDPKPKPRATIKTCSTKEGAP
jgi:hypothetical protein